MSSACRTTPERRTEPWYSMQTLRSSTLRSSANLQEISIDNSYHPQEWTTHALECSREYWKQIRPLIQLAQFVSKPLEKDICYAMKCFSYAMTRHYELFCEITKAIGKCKAPEKNHHCRVHITLTLAYFHPLESTCAVWISVLQCLQHMQKVNTTKSGNKRGVLLPRLPSKDDRN